MFSRMIGRNLMANLFGQGWTALMALLFVPFYLQLLGAEGFGLIGFFMTVSAVFTVMDGGLGATVTREAATFTDSTNSHRAELADLLHTVEILFGSIAVLAGLVFMLLAPSIGKSWLQVTDGQMQDVIRALFLMGMALALQFQLGFYSGCLIGLQRQVTLNSINAVSATLRGGGAVLVLWLVSPTLTAFFAWQCVVGILSAAYQHQVVWHALGTPRPRFRADSLKRTGRFTAGVAFVNVLALILTQLDKVLLSKLLPLQSFGYYMIAWTAGTVALRVAGPVFNAYYPVITQLAATPEKRTELPATYLQSALLLSIGVVPVTMCLAFFGEPLLLAWTSQPAAANAAALPLTLICIGTMCNAFMHMPYALQLAHGKTRLTLTQNLIAVLILAPLTIYFTRRFGLAGAAVPWLLLNIGYLLISAPLAYHNLLDDVRARWYRGGVVVPIIIGISLALPFYLWSQMTSSLHIRLLLATTSTAISIFACSWYASYENKKFRKL